MIEKICQAFPSVQRSVQQKEEGMSRRNDLSVELFAFRRHYSDLVGSIQDPEDLSVFLYTKNIISPGVRDEVQESRGLTKRRKCEVLINAVEAKITSHPQAFHAFINVLRSMPYIAALADTMARTVATEKQEREWLDLEPILHDVDPSDEPNCGERRMADARWNTMELRRRKFSSAEAKERLKVGYDVLHKVLNPSDIVATLYSAGVITSSDRDSVNNAMYTLDERNTKLLSAVERAVSANPDNFAKFLGILDNIVTYKPIVAKVLYQSVPPGNTSPEPPATSTIRREAVPQRTIVLRLIMGAVVVFLLLCLALLVLNLKERNASTPGNNQDPAQTSLNLSTTAEKKHIVQTRHLHGEQTPLPQTVESCRLELTTKNLFNEVFAKVPAKWKSIGIQLDLWENELEDIESQTAGLPNRNIEASSLVMAKWKALQRSQYSWAVIIEALDSNVVGEHRLATELRTKCNSKL